jgi:hypothetical protein
MVLTGSHGNAQGIGGGLGLLPIPETCRAAITALEPGGVLE